MRRFCDVVSLASCAGFDIGDSSLAQPRMSNSGEHTTTIRNPNASLHKLNLIQGLVLPIACHIEHRCTKSSFQEHREKFLVIPLSLMLAQRDSRIVLRINFDEKPVSFLTYINIPPWSDDPLTHHGATG